MFIDSNPILLLILRLPIILIPGSSYPSNPRKVIHPILPLTLRLRTLLLSGKSPMGLGIPPLIIKIMLESNPLKPTMLVGERGVRRMIVIIMTMETSVIIVTVIHTMMIIVIMLRSAHKEARCYA